MIKITVYTPSYYKAVYDFISKQWYLHQHLDWMPLTDWLKKEHDLVFLAFQDQRIIGVIALSQPYSGMSWLRLIALKQEQSEDIFSKLLASAISSAIKKNITRLMILQMNSWLTSMLEQNAFSRTDYLTHLEFRGVSPPMQNTKFKIKNVKKRHLDIIETLDHLAFDIPWQMRRADFLAAQKFENHFTMAINPETKVVVGYQLSTLYRGSGVHLARLATNPTLQRQGIGSLLVTDLIQHFPNQLITVNTQSTNEKALRLYMSLGFQKQAMTTPVWQCHLG